MTEISTSVLNIAKEEIIKTIYKLETAKTDYFHIDVMDGRFVENDTTELMNEYCGYMNTISNIPLDVHLMVEDVESYVKNYLIYNPNIITFQYEALKNDKEKMIKIIEYIKFNHCRVGIAIKPETQIEEIHEILPMIHIVLVMTVEPGQGGQKLVDNVINKIIELKKYISDKNYEIDIEADGGINLSNANRIKNAGTNIIVSGTGIIKSDDIKETIKKLKND